MSFAPNSSPPSAPPLPKSSADEPLTEAEKQAVIASVKRHIQSGVLQIPPQTSAPQ